MEQSGKVSADNGPIEEGGGGIGLLIANRFLLFLQPVAGCVGPPARTGSFPVHATHARGGTSRPESCTDSGFQHRSLCRSAVQQPPPSPPHHPKISPPEDEKGRRCSWTQIKGIEQRKSFDLLSVRPLQRQTKIDAKKQSPKNSSEVQNLILTAVLGCGHTNILILDIS